MLKRLVCFAYASMFGYELLAMNYGILDRVIPGHLNNNLCTKISSSGGHKECVYRSRNTETEPILGIMLHYTVCQSIESTVQAYYAGGVSAHYTIYHDRSPYCHVDPSNIAFHAGASQFRGKTALNRYYIGVEHVNPGFYEPGTTYSAIWGEPVKLFGDPRAWFQFGDSQFVASACLTANLQQKYKIPGSLVITHADAAPGRKSDIGLMYNYKRAFEDYHAGYLRP